MTPDAPFPKLVLTVSTRSSTSSSDLHLLIQKGFRLRMNIIPVVTDYGIIPMFRLPWPRRTRQSNKRQKEKHHPGTSVRHPK